MRDAASSLHVDLVSRSRTTCWSPVIRSPAAQIHGPLQMARCSCEDIILLWDSTQKQQYANRYMSGQTPNWDATTALINVGRQLEATFANVLLLSATEVDNRVGCVVGVVVPSDSDASTLGKVPIVIPPHSQATKTDFPGGFYVSGDGQTLLTVVACSVGAEFESVQSREVQVVNAVFDIPQNNCVVVPEGISIPDVCLEGIPKYLLSPPQESSNTGK
jgi:hypothetical protein